jgi:NodT family efflux transporter outer membrane factor (OMF) lipoprotein
MKRGVVIALGVGLAGCVVGPNYRTPSTPASGHGAFVSAAPAIAASAPLPPGWWRLYSDPLLDNLVQQALVENDDLKVAAANLAYAQGLLDEAKAGRYPTTDLSLAPSYGRSSTQVQLGQGPSMGYAGSFVAAYQIDLFGRVRRTIEAASANADAAQAAEDAVRVTVAAETASAYANICGYGRQVAVARSSLDAVQKTYDLFVVQRNAGAIGDFDLDRQGVLLEQAKALIPPLEGQRRAALFTLAALIGKTPVEVPVQAAACVVPPTLTQPLPVGDGAALLRRRPDVRQAERQLASKTAGIGVATADLYPTVTLSGSVGSAATTIGGLFAGPAVAYGIGSNASGVPPLISWSFPNTLVARAHIEEARAQASAALATFDGTVLTALKETEQALALLATELDHHTALVAARTRANEALRLAQVQFQAGSYSFLDLLTAQQASIEADQAVAASEQTLSTDQVAVFQALGGGWENAPPVTAPPIAGHPVQSR